MGSNCSCIHNTPGEEVEIENPKKPAKIIVEQQAADSFDDNCLVTIEFIPLAESNPLLSFSLSLQSLARGFFDREHYALCLSQKLFGLTLQTVSKSFLAKQKINSSLNSKHFGIYDYLEGTIQQYTTLDLALLALDGIKQVLKSQALVRISTGSVYQGEWDQNSHLQNGFGIHTYEDGSTYIGNFVQGKKEGKGVSHNFENLIYEGGFKDDLYDGKGSLKFTEGRTISGKFVSGYLEGEGKEEWDNGTLYEGKFVKSRKQGHGLLTVPKFSTYKGEFFKDKFHGSGKLTMENQTSYEGEWDKGRMHGKGTFTWPNGKVYVGEYLFDKKHGHGRMKYPNKSVYNGEWVEDLQHGKAIYTFFNKKKSKMISYNSYWENGNKITYLKKDGTFFEASDSDA